MGLVIVANSSMIDLITSMVGNLKESTNQGSTTREMPMHMKLIVMKMTYHLPV